MAETSICTRSTTDLAPEDERITIRDLVTTAESNTKEGDTFYLLIQKWWQNWLEYVNQEDSFAQEQQQQYIDSVAGKKRPPEIDNSDLIYESTVSEVSNGGNEGMEELHDTLVEGRDYVLLPKPVWNQLYAWYGGGPAVARKVIRSGLSQSELAVEVYPLCLQLLVMPKGDQATIRISKKEPIGELHKRACDVFDLKLEQVCIWDYYGHRKHALMNDMGRTLDDANIQTDQDILVEVQNNVTSTLSRLRTQENGSMASIVVEPFKSSLSIAGGLSASKGVSRSCSSELLQSHVITSPVREVDNAFGTSGIITRGAPAGLTGLLNLGNTCFMNSAIQCLVHTPEFATYFREDYHQEINWQNPLGMVGELAIAFGELLRKLWAPGRMPVAPRPFKAKLARFAPQFSGYNQHDSQELLAFLLDGLHEDLNRVKHKPYIKSKDADGRPEEDVADEYWANHIARNDSIIVDVCQGQYKSTLVCPVCNKISVTFDPFMYLSLPLQSTTTRTMTVTVFTSDKSVMPAACTVTVPKHGRCRDLIQALTSTCSLKYTEKILLAEVRGHMIQRFLVDPLISLSTIKDDDHLAAYKIAKIEKKTIILQLVHRREEEENINFQSTKGWIPYGTPLVSQIPCEDVITRGDIQSLVHTMLSPMLKTECVNNIENTNTDVLDSVHEDSSCSNIIMPPKLPLQLVVENSTCIDLSVGERKAIRLSSSSETILVYIDWSQKLLDKYDTKYVENLPEVFKYGYVSKKARTEPLSLYTCLEAFLREEPLVPEDMWYCPQCKEQRQASKKLDIWRLPEVLIIHLKRFSYSRSMKHKLETFVNFPIHDFDLTKYVANKSSYRPQLYELYALTNHDGGMGSGHYTAHIKLLDENKWYNFDDNHISAIHEEEIKSGSAYVLFYRRVNTNHATATNGAAGPGTVSIQK